MAEKRPDRTRGPLHDDFWAFCAKGELHLQRCGACHKLTWPVAKVCQYCASPALAWERMSGHGKIVSWVTFERDYYNGVLPIPWETILVELDEGPLFISNPQGLTWKDIEFGMPVQVAFTECEDSGGTYSLPVFRRA
jgi:uncharacterized OB-fold protein